MPKTFMKAIRLIFAILCALSLCMASQPSLAAKDNGIIINDTGNPGQQPDKAKVYLNPQFRYQGSGTGDGSRLRTQHLKEAMYGMLVGDFNGDKRNEVAILTSHYVAIYSWGEGGRLKELGRQKIASSNENFCFRSIDLNRDGVLDFVVTTYEEADSRPYSFFYTFKGNRFSEVAKRAPYFVSVARIPPYFTPTLIGQGWDSIRLFDRGVRVMEKDGDSYRLGAKIALPKEANCYNFNWIPAGRDNRLEQLVVLTDDEKLKIYQGKNLNLIHTTMERFSGSSVGMDHYKGMPGLGIDRTYQIPNKYFAPMNLITADIGHTGEPVLLVNKPISTASQFFERYRYFPQGEIHALYWDGVGMALKWKTRRIRGSVAAVDLADVNNDGVLELVVGLNTSPAIGIGSRQCMVTAYPLDVSAMNPHVPADMSDFEVNPNN